VLSGNARRPGTSYPLVTGCALSRGTRAEKPAKGRPWEQQNLDHPVSPARSASNGSSLYCCRLPNIYDRKQSGAGRLTIQGETYLGFNLDYEVGRGAAG
jgi:hypothetical protein